MGKRNTQVNRWCANKIFLKVASCTKSSVYVCTDMRTLLGEKKRGEEGRKKYIMGRP